jgi:hypothetical protein
VAETKNTVSRRGFIGKIGAAVAVTAIPLSAVARSPLTWPETLEAWPGAFRELVERFRPLYTAEVARLAETLRPRFESGELHAMTDEELEDGESGATAPIWKVEAAAGEHFGLTKGASFDKDREICEGAEHVAHMVLAVSPSAPYAGDGWVHVAYEAREAAMWDVVLYAREHGGYTPLPTEQLGRSFEEDRELQAARDAGARS